VYVVPKSIPTIGAPEVGPGVVDPPDDAALPSVLGSDPAIVRSGSPHCNRTPTTREDRGCTRIRTRAVCIVSYTPGRVESRRPAVLLVVDDPGALDLLTRVFESRRFSVATAATARQAIAALEGGRTVDVIVAAWDPQHAIGGEVYRWVLAHRIELRAHFVFLADDVAPDFDRLVGGRCLAVRPEEVEELVRVVEAGARRHQRIEHVAAADVAWLDADRPALLLVEDDPIQLIVMTGLLGDVGFTVTAVESGNAAIAQLEEGDFTVILSDWYMADGSGGDLYRWVCTTRPWLLDRLVYITAGDLAGPTETAVGVPVLPKGQDSEALLALLATTARKARAAS
jgi:CheY-like chemotaxis protein